MEDIERVYREWIDSINPSDEIREYLNEHKESYYAFLVFFLKDTIHKAKK